MARLSLIGGRGKRFIVVHSGPCRFYSLSEPNQQIIAYQLITYEFQAVFKN